MPRLIASVVILFAGMSICTAFTVPRVMLRNSVVAPSSFVSRRVAVGVTSQGARRSFLTSTVACAESPAKGGRASAAVVQDAGKKHQTQEKLDLQPPRGTRDFYPEDMRLRNWLFGHWREVARVYGFEEYDAPVVESEALYIRKAGEEVAQQLYNFEDKGGRRLSLRPEMTPSLARMVLAKGKGLVPPVKWFSFPQCWRYERMTRGRRREHYQWNMDIWGIPSVEAEAELLAAMVTFFKRVGITSDDVGIKVNSRAVLAEVLKAMGVPDDKFAATCVLVDKLEKVKIEEIQGEMEALGLTKKIIDKLLDTLKIRDVNELKSVVGENSSAVQELVQLFEYAEAYGCKDWLVFDASVVRGLAYYTGVVFEGFDRKGELRAVCGGGRYDKLLETFGGDPLPACGFGFGDAVIVELLKDKNVLPSFASNGVQVVVFPFGATERPTAMRVASTLRSMGVSVDLVMEDKKPKWLFKHAERLGAQKVVLIGTEEVASGKIKVKDLATGEQTEVDMADMSSEFSSLTQ